MLTQPDGGGEPSLMQSEREPFGAMNSVRLTKASGVGVSVGVSVAV